MTFEDLDS